MADGARHYVLRIGDHTLGTISDLAVSSVGDGTATLTWTAPANAASQQPQRRLTGGSTWTSIGSALSGTAETVEATGLVNGSPYDFRVAATDGATVTYSNTATGTPTSSGIYPLTVSSQTIQKADGSALAINGEAAWSAASQLTAAELDIYLSDRAAKGLNAIIVNLIEAHFSDTSPVYDDSNGNPPFNSTTGGYLDFSDPNTSYWSWIDDLIDAANSYDIIVIACMAYLGYGHGSEGWAAAISANGSTKMGQYGTFLAQRYASKPNIIWLLGGDADPVDTYNLTAEIGALATAIKADDSVHLMTAHPAPGSLGSDQYSSWIDFDTAYPSGNTTLAAAVKTGYQNTPALPVLMVEGYYGNEHSMTDLLLRTEMYQSVLGGMVGHVYGNSPMWYFGVDSGASGNSFADTGGLDWATHLDSFGAAYLPYVEAIQAAYDLSTLTPDYSHTAVTAGYGTEGAGYASAAYSSDLLIAYVPGGSGQTLTIDKSQFTAGTFDVSWYNPRNGSTTSGGTTMMGSGSENFTAPDTNDWVLILEPTG